MNMERVKEIEEQLQYAVQHQTLPGRWSHNIGELMEIIKQQQEQMETLEKEKSELNKEIGRFFNRVWAIAENQQKGYKMSHDLINQMLSKDALDQ